MDSPVESLFGCCHAAEARTEPLLHGLDSPVPSGDKERENGRAAISMDGRRTPPTQILETTSNLPNAHCFSNLRSDCHYDNPSIQAYCPQATTSSVGLIEATCTLGAWILHGTAFVVSFEATKFIMVSLSTYDDSLSTRTVALSAVAFMSWAFAAAMLLAAFKRILVGDFNVPPTTGMHEFGVNGQQRNKCTYRRSAVVRMSTKNVEEVSNPQVSC